MEIFSGDFKDIFYDEEAEKRKEKRKERRDELQKAKIPEDYSPNQREINWFLVSSKVGCLFYGLMEFSQDRPLMVRGSTVFIKPRLDWLKLQIEIFFMVSYQFSTFQFSRIIMMK